MSHLFDPLPLAGIVLPNRIGVSPMCQYSAVDGLPQDWHFVHYGSRAAGGAGVVIVEAAAVAPEARISLGDLGLWADFQIAPLAKIAAFMQAQGCIAGIQLAHAGRKASAPRGWEEQRSLSAAEGGWATLAPSALAFGEGYATPQEIDAAGIARVIEQFAQAARRVKSAGFQLLELHAAHGYLLHKFLSPLANRRSDAYGGSLENRSRLLREVVAAVRGEWPREHPLLVRLSATDWVAGGWDVAETIELCRALKALGVDLVDVSSAGMVPTAKVPVGPGYQTEFAARIRREVDIPTAAVGLITSAAQAAHVIRSGQADLVLLGREALRDPYWPLHAARELGRSVPWPSQYLRAAVAGTPAR